MSRKMIEALCEEFPMLDEEESEEIVKMLLQNLVKHDLQIRKVEKVTIGGPRRNLVFISKALTAARIKAGLLQDHVTAATEWSPSKIVRLEGGESPPSKPDIQALAKIYGLDKKTEDEWIAKRRG